MESKILTKSLEFIPKYGFHQECINQAVNELKYPSSIISVLTASFQSNLFQSNSLELQLMIHWLKTQRQKLSEEVITEEFKALNEYDKLTYLINQRLSYNIPIIEKLSQGLAHLVVPYNISHSLEELLNLSDDIAFYAGDQSIDFAWYSKRFSFSTVYVSSELYMIQDKSKDFVNTKRFVQDKVNNVKFLGESYENMEEWSLFNVIQLTNLIKSQLIRG